MQSPQNDKLPIIRALNEDELPFIHGGEGSAGTGAEEPNSNAHGTGQN